MCNINMLHEVNSSSKIRTSKTLAPEGFMRSLKPLSFLACAVPWFGLSATSNERMISIDLHHSQASTTSLENRFPLQIEYIRKHISDGLEASLGMYTILLLIARIIASDRTTTRLSIMRTIDIAILNRKCACTALQQFREHRELSVALASLEWERRRV